MLNKVSVDLINGSYYIDNHIMIDLVIKNVTTNHPVELKMNGTGRKILRKKVNLISTSNAELTLTISDDLLMQQLNGICFRIGKRFHQIFETQVFSYQTIFIKSTDFNIRNFIWSMLKLRNPEFWNAYSRETVKYICVSYPVNKKGMINVD